MNGIGRSTIKLVHNFIIFQAFHGFHRLPTHRTNGNEFGLGITKYFVIFIIYNDQSRPVVFLPRGG